MGEKRAGLLRSGDLWAGLLLAAMGVFIIVTASGWLFLGPAGPGPGFIPMWHGVLMLLFAVLLVVTSVLRHVPAPGAPSLRAEWRLARRGLGIWLAFAIAVGLLKLLGFFIAFALLALFIVTVLYRKPLLVGVATAVSASVAFYLIFPLALGLRLPTGPLGF